MGRGTQPQPKGRLSPQASPGKDGQAAEVSASVPGRWRRRREARGPPSPSGDAARGHAVPLPAAGAARAAQPAPLCGLLGGPGARLPEVPAQQAAPRRSRRPGAPRGPGPRLRGGDQNGPEAPPRGGRQRIPESGAPELARGALRAREWGGGGARGARWPRCRVHVAAGHTVKPPAVPPRPQTRSGTGRGAPARTCPGPETGLRCSSVR